DYAFKEKVEALSGGTIKIDLQCSGILGDVDAVTDMMLKPHSSIHIHRMSAVNMASYGCTKTGLLSVPYTFSNKEQFWRFVKTESAQEILDEPEEAGLNLKGLFFGEEGFRHFFSTKPIRRIEDFSGLRIRGTNDSAMQGVITALHATSVPVNYADVYARFQTGVIDAAEQPIANYLANHFYEIAPYMLLDGHTLGVMEVVITREAWDSLTEKQQQILLKAGQYASEYCHTLSTEEEDAVRKELESRGAVITEATDRAAWKEACRTVIDEAAKGAPMFYQEIQNQIRVGGSRPPRRTFTTQQEK
nr:TRAP transporter substrate-binding protein [Treponema sp.]